MKIVGLQDKKATADKEHPGPAGEQWRLRDECWCHGIKTEAIA